MALAASVTALTAAPAAYAADLLPPIVQPEPLPVPPSFGGWYLRGDIGITNQGVDDLHNAVLDSAASWEYVNDPSFDSGGLVNVGVGYQFNSWARVDLTGQYRGKTSFHAFDRYDTNGNGYLPTDTDNGTNQYTAMKSEWLFLANAYFDLGTWNGISPYVGAGIGASRNTIHGITDINDRTGGGGYGGEHSEWNLAWALHAGVAYQMTQNLAIDLGYSYVSLGDASSGDIVDFNGNSTIYNPAEFEDLYSHDIKLGMRYTFGGPSMPAMPSYGEPAYGAPVAAAY
ncbi:cell envelope biogenesis protein OmpA [Afifella sp. IM 167]|nr:cell envelope biogenesis protein OmpA [Afifella sp. IM 167]